MSLTAGLVSLATGLVSLTAGLVSLTAGLASLAAGLVYPFLASFFTYFLTSFLALGCSTFFSYLGASLAAFSAFLAS